MKLSKAFFFRYSMLDYFCLALHLLLGKLLYPRSRLIRFPFYVRGSAQIDFGVNLSAGRFCRIDVLSLSTTSAKHSAKKLVFGENVQIGDRVQIAAAESVIIGDHCLIASNVFVSDHDHGSTEFDSMLIPPSERDLITAPIQIGHSCWIGQNVCILKGVILGENSIVAAGAVVTRSFPAFSVIGGVPARILKSPQMIQQP